MLHACRGVARRASGVGTSQPPAPTGACSSQGAAATSWTARAVSSAAVAVVALALPYLPFAPLFDLVPLAPALVATVILVTAAYALVSELAKHRFYAAVRGKRAVGRSRPR